MRNSYTSYWKKELEAKDGRALECRIRNARFPYRKYIEDLELDCLPADMRNKLPELATLDFIRDGRNVIMYGNPGTGKTHTSISLGIKACISGYKVLFTTIPLLVTQLKECQSAKTLTAFKHRFEKHDLIIAMNWDTFRLIKRVLNFFLPTFPCGHLGNPL